MPHLLHLNCQELLEVSLVSDGEIREKCRAKYAGVFYPRYFVCIMGKARTYRSVSLMIHEARVNSKTFLYYSH
jgi:hypothetical protein